LNFNFFLRYRTSGGRLHLLNDVGKIALADTTLVEDPSESSGEEDDPSVCSQSTRGSTLSVTESMVAGNRDFKLYVESKNGTRLHIHLAAPTVQDKEAWISDISQCIDNIHMHSLLSPGLVGTSGASLLSAAHALKTDPRLFKDDVDIRFSRTLNSCKLPQVRYATPERLLQRLTDLRFLSIDFLNTFLLTYRVFTDGETVLNALKNVFYNPPVEPTCECDHQTDFLDIPYQDGRCGSPRRTSGASSVSGYCSEGADRDRSLSGDSAGLRYRPRKISNPHSTLDQESNLTWIPEGESCGPLISSDGVETEESDEVVQVVTVEPVYLTIPGAVTTSSSTDTIIENLVPSGSTSPSNLSSVTLVGSTGSVEKDKAEEPTTVVGKPPPAKPLPERIPPSRPQRPHEKLGVPAPIVVKPTSDVQTTKTIVQPPTPPAVKPPQQMFQPLDSKKATATETVVQKSLVTTTSASKVMMQTHFPAFPNTTSSTVTLTTTTTTITAASKTVISKAISPPHIGITTTTTIGGFDRRPSVGCNVIPHAALCQHRYSLQLNGESGSKVSNLRN
jgi:RasGEF N-terminal motif